MKTIFTFIRAKFTFLVGTIVLFCLIYLFHFQATALMKDISLGYSLINTLVYAYFFLLLFYVFFRFCEIYFSTNEETDFELLESLQFILKYCKKVFGGLVGMQIFWHLYTGYQSISNTPEANIFHYLISELINLFQIGSEYIRYHIELIIRVNNPCFLGYCANEYPVVPYLLAILAFTILRKLMRNQMTRSILKFLYKYVIKLAVITFNFSLKFFAKLLRIGFKLLRKLMIHIFKTNHQGLLSKAITPLTAAVLDHSLAIIWSELRLADSWIEKLSTYFEKPNQDKK